MTTRARVLGWSAIFCLATGGAADAKEPERIEVQHILVGFSGSVPGKPVTRSKDDALKLAEKLFKDAKKGKADFGKLVQANTDDSAPGIYKMVNRGVTPGGQDEYSRDQMVAAFGDVGFKLKVGEVGLAKYDAAKSPFGFHIIKRLK